MTADTLGGVWGYALELSSGLSKLGGEVVLATMGRRLSPAQAASAAKVSNLDVRESEYSLEWMPGQWADVDAAGDWLMRLAEEVRPDVVHLNGFAHAALPFHSPRVVVCHSCVCSWWRAVKGESAPAEWNEYRRRVAGGLLTAEAIVAPTRAILNAVLSCYPHSARGRRAPREYVIANGVDASKYRVDDKQAYIIGAGRLWDEAKNLLVLDQLRELPWPVYLAGSEDRPDGMKPVVGKGAQRLGQLDGAELASWMAHASIYVLPAYYEPFGLSAVEAALSGCALVLGDIDSLREVWGSAPIYVDPRDNNALRETLLWLIEHPVDLSRVAEQCHQRALRYTHSSMASNYRALYDQLTSEEPRLAEGTL